MLLCLECIEKDPYCNGSSRQHLSNSESNRIYDAFPGGKRIGKRGRGPQGKKPVLVAVETRTKSAGFVAMQAVNTVSQKIVRDFLKFNLIKGQNVRTGAFSALNAVAENHFHEKKVTPPEESPLCVGNVQEAIEFKMILLGLFL
ncbi:MAG: hypothetical protein ACI8PB_005404 [Desulforhopalus sp.]|jgi:hypothetical protein